MRYLLPPLLLATLTVAGCATPYGPATSPSYGFGYSEERLDTGKYRVTFRGNGNTSGNTVWDYWMYRCAELTLSLNYHYFTLEKDTGQKPQLHSDARDSYHLSNTAWQPGSDGGLMTVAGHGGGGGYHYYAPTYTTITTWHSSGIITLYADVPQSGSEPLLDAVKISAAIKPYVDSEGKTGIPDRKTILMGAMVFPPDFHSAPPPSFGLPTTPAAPNFGAPAAPTTPDVTQPLKSI